MAAAAAKYGRVRDAASYLTALAAATSDAVGGVAYLDLKVLYRAKLTKSN